MPIGIHIHIHKTERIDMTELKVDNSVAWQANIREFETVGMDADKKIDFMRDLNNAVQRVCWEYGVHN
jgi:hypothetical protein